MKKVIYLFVIFLIVAISACKVTPVVIEKQQNKRSANNSSLLIEATLNHHELNTRKEDLYLENFKYLTPTNATKQSRVHPEPGVWRWEEIDDFINFSDKNNLVVRLHGPISQQVSR
tara:strand:+ start:1481 stop:1828 length:348 start_codon:yes stop_codon:yes gene_type:complete